MNTENKTLLKNLLTNLGIYTGLFILQLYWFQYLIAEIFQKSMTLFDLGVCSIVLGLVTPTKYRGLQRAMAIIGTIYLICTQ